MNFFLYSQPVKLGKRPESIHIYYKNTFGRARKLIAFAVDKWCRVEYPNEVTSYYRRLPTWESTAASRSWWGTPPS